MNRLSRSPWLSRLAIAGGVVGIVSFTVMHLTMSEQVNPFRQPVSMYVLDFPGNVLFPLGVLGLAMSCLLLAVRGIRPYRHIAARWLLAFASVMLVAVVVFRTDASEGVSSMVGEVHRYAAGASFTLLTSAGINICVRAGAEWPSRWPMVLTAISSATLIIITVNLFAPTLLEAAAWRGVPQRILLTVQAVLILLLATTPRHAGRRARLALTGTPVNTRQAREWAFWEHNMPKPSDGPELWLSGRGGGPHCALPSGNGLRSTTLCRQ
jgi:hypothetical protein